MKCCTCNQYEYDTFHDGYVMTRLLPVKICDNCGEVQSYEWRWWQNLLAEILLPFWNGLVHVYRDEDEE